MATLYHNPRCSKSRAALELLVGAGVDVDVVRYLDAPPDVTTLNTLVKLLGSVADIIRVNEEIYRELGLDLNQPQAALIKAVAENPKLLQRPIFMHQGKAVVGRPPEKVLTIL